MNKKFEYQEPEFKAVSMLNPDLITTSETPSDRLGIVTKDWEMSENLFEI